MKIYPLCVLALLILTGCGGERTRQAEAIIEKVGAIYAPDQRVALFTITALPAPNGQVALQGETTLPEAKAALLLQLDSAGIFPEDYIKVLPSEELGDHIYGLVKVSPCNIRSLPRHSAELATQALLGTPLRVYKREGDWYLVQTPDGYLGWLDSGGFQPLDRAGLAAWQQSERLYFGSDYGYVLQDYQQDGPRRILVDLLPGSIVTKAGNPEGLYIPVRLPDGRKGYVMEEMLRPLTDWWTEPQLDTAALFGRAYRLLGRPYLWGGTSPKAMDCSGFTKSVFHMSGLLLPRDASQQVHTGLAVDTDSTLRNLLPGDLLFFGRKATAEEKEKITHVGLYLGDGRMIHAGSDNGAVRIESLRSGDPDFAESRLQSFVRARRVLASPGENGVRWLREMPIYQASHSQ